MSSEPLPPIPPLLVQQLQQLHQQLGTQIQMTDHLPSPFVTLLETQLALDARSLLLTSQFRLFVRLLLAQMAAHALEFPYPLQVTADPQAWLLQTLPIPLQLHRLPGVDSAIGVQVELGDWQQVFLLPSAAERTEDDNKAATHSWSAIAEQLIQTMPQLPIAPALQLFLSQELLCVLVYLGEFVYGPTFDNP